MVFITPSSIGQVICALDNLIKMVVSQCLLRMTTEC